MFRKRRRYVFRKRSIRGRILGPAISVLVVVAGLVLLVPWLMFSSTDEDASNMEDPKNLTVQASPEDQPEQKTETARSEDEQARGDAPTVSEEASNGPPPPSSGQPSPPPLVQAPPLPSTLPPPSPGVEVTTDFSTPSGYWDAYEPGY